MSSKTIPEPVDTGVNCQHVRSVAVGSGAGVVVVEGGGVVESSAPVSSVVSV
jgi:hypothetical protein